MRNAPKIGIVVYLESYEYFTILGDFFRKFSSPLLCLIIDSPPGFRGYFAFFSMRKKAINIILNDLESSQRGLQSLVKITIFPFWVI